MPARGLPVQPRMRDGIGDALTVIANLCDEGARRQREARHLEHDGAVALPHANIEAEMLLMQIADRARRLRR